MRRWLELGCLLLLGLALPLQAEEARTADAELSLEELLRQGLSETPRDVEVSTASRYAQSAADSPTLTFVLTAEDIRSMGLRNMADILRALPGLYITDNGMFTYVGARGLGRPGDYNARLLFLLDGMRLNENIYDSAGIGEEFPVEVGQIERVEFAPGPGAAVYGNNAFFGVVHVITQRAGQMRGGRLHASLDSERGKRLGAAWGQRLDNGWEWTLHAAAHERDRIPTPYEIPERYRAERLDYDWLRVHKIHLYAGGAGLQLRAGASQSVRGSPIPLFDGQDYFHQQGEDVLETVFVQASYDTSLGDWDLWSSLAVQRALYRFDQPYRLEDGEAGVLRFDALGRWSLLELQLSRQLHPAHRLSLGLDYQRDHRQDVSFSQLGGPLLQAYWGRNRRLGLFVQDEWQITPTQHLVLGLRRDRTELGSRSLNPRLAWVWQATPQSSLRLMYGSAFRETNLYEFMVNHQMDAPITAPERVRTLELAWEQRLDQGWSYRLSGFSSRLRDLISLDESSDVYINEPVLRSRGLELGLARRWPGGARLDLALSLQRSEDSRGTGLSNSPRTLLKSRWHQPLAAHWQLAWQWQLMSRRNTPAGPLAGYAVHDLHLQWQPRPGLSFSTGLHNALDRRYQDRSDGFGPPIERPGRSLQLALDWRFGS